MGKQNNGIESVNIPIGHLHKNLSYLSQVNAMLSAEAETVTLVLADDSIFCSMRNETKKKKSLRFQCRYRRSEVVGTLQRN